LGRFLTDGWLKRANKFPKNNTKAGSRAIFGLVLFAWISKHPPSHSRMLLLIANAIKNKNSDLKYVQAPKWCSVQSQMTYKKFFFYFQEEEKNFFSNIDTFV